jgi:hypothetical protein
MNDLKIYAAAHGSLTVDTLAQGNTITRTEKNQTQENWHNMGGGYKYLQKLEWQICPPPKSRHNTGWRQYLLDPGPWVNHQADGREFNKPRPNSLILVIQYIEVYRG